MFIRAFQMQRLGKIIAISAAQCLVRQCSFMCLDWNNGLQLAVCIADNDDRLLSQTSSLSTATIHWTSLREDVNHMS